MLGVTGSSAHLDAVQDLGITDRIYHTCTAFVVLSAGSFRFDAGYLNAIGSAFKSCFVCSSHWGPSFCIIWSLLNSLKHPLFFSLSFLLRWTLSYNKLAQSDSFLCRSHLLWDHLHLLWKHYMHHDWVRVNLIFNNNEIVLKSVENCTWRRMIDGMGGWGYFQAMRVHSA